MTAPGLAAALAPVDQHYLLMGYVNPPRMPVYLLAWAGDSGSQLLFRAQAAITAIHNAGLAVNRLGERSPSGGMRTVSYQ